MPRTMTVTEREGFLAKPHIGVIAVDAGPGRAPLAVPIWYTYEPGGLVTVMTGPKSEKARLIAGTGRYSLTVQDEKPPYKYVTASGPVVETVAEAQAPERLAAAQRYLGEEGGRGFMDQMGGVVEVAFRMRPERWRSADYSEE
ncbi:MAG: pyridoxamine 5'-phosphate oxidase family protein [Candidatus Dormibacteraceae bacterium]